MASKVALFGASGKMGTRISDKLREAFDYELLPVETGESALARLRQRGFEPREASAAAGQADIVVLALPDIVLAQIAKEIVPFMQSGAMLVCLDPAASHGEEFPRREDVSEKDTVQVGFADKLTGQPRSCLINWNVHESDRPDQDLGGPTAYC